ncbi:MAG: HAD family hydrolase [Cellulosilyticaceae bacterium]
MNKLVIFDIDGTLLDSVLFNVKGLNQTLEAMGFKHRVDEMLVRAYLGCTGEDFYAGVLDSETRVHWEAIRAYNRKYNGELMLRYGRGFKGVKKTIENLKNAGAKIAIYSNCSRVYMDRAIQVVGIGEWVDYHECVKDHGIEKPELVEKIIDHFGGVDAVVVGDRIHDYEAALANEIPCIGVMYGYGCDEMVDCDYHLYRMEELVEILKRIG